MFSLDEKLIQLRNNYMGQCHNSVGQTACRGVEQNAVEGRGWGCRCPNCSVWFWSWKFFPNSVEVSGLVRSVPDLAVEQKVNSSPVSEEWVYLQLGQNWTLSSSVCLADGVAVLRSRQKKSWCAPKPPFWLKASRPHTVRVGTVLILLCKIFLLFILRS